MRKRRSRLFVTRKLAMLLAAALLLALLVVLSVAFGALSLPVTEVIAALFGGGEPQSRMLVHSLRLPRTLVALMIGGSLGVAGALMQGVFRNPLASPDVMGVGGGASAAAVAFITFGAGNVSIHWLPVAAIGGALVTSALIYILGWRGGSSPQRLILIGVGISTAMSALTTFLLISGSSFKASQLLNWLTGTVYGASRVEVYVLLPWVAVGLPLAWLTARRLDILALGDATASGLGEAINRSRLLVLLISVLLAGAAVSLAGAVGFIGLMAPHIARSLLGVRYAWIIPMSALVGASLMVGADMIGRLAFMPYDLPAGIFTAAIGAPFFFYLLYRNRQWH